jgi:hypothetical protein
MKRFLFLFLFLLCASPVFGQGAFIPPQVALQTVNGITRPIPGATITVCASAAVGVPCSPALTNTVFSNAVLTQPLSNPFTADANGNYQFAAAGGNYTVTVSASGFSGYSYQVTVSCQVGACSVSGNFSVSGSLTVGGPFTAAAGGSLFGTFAGPTIDCNFNGVICPAAFTDTAIQAAATFICSTIPGSTLYLPAGNYSINTGNITIACPMNIIGAGAIGSNLNVAAAISSSSDVFLVNPTTNGDQIHFADFGISNAGFGRYGVHLNGATAAIQHITIERILIGQMGGSYGIYAEGTGAGEGTPRLLNLNASTIFGGFGCNNCGDTVRLTNDEFIGVGSINFLGFQPGSSTPIVDKNNITLTGGVHFGPVTISCQFTNNEVETVNFTSGNWAGSNGAMLDLDGSSGNAIQACNVAGNSFQPAVTTIATTAIRANYVNGANIHDNRIGRGSFAGSQDFNWTGNQTFPILGPNMYCGTTGVCGSTFNMSGTGACGTLVNEFGNFYQGTVKCNAVTAASTLTITPGTNAPDGWNCKSVTDITTPANLFTQTASTTTTCTVSAASITNGDVITWTAVPY